MIIVSAGGAGTSRHAPGELSGAARDQRLACRQRRYLAGVTLDAVSCGLAMLAGPAST
jgi:hypothetical protein